MSGRILLADDEKGLVSMMAAYFELCGYQVLTACSGAEALEKAARLPDLILLDINMPDVDGFTVCRRIREHVSCPILFLTARIETGDKIEGFRAGADDYIVKPFDLEELGARGGPPAQGTPDEKAECHAFFWGIVHRLFRAPAPNRGNADPFIQNRICNRRASLRKCGTDL